MKKKTSSGRQQAPQEVRLNKFIANTGVCSRREADTLIQSGSIQVNGKTITTQKVKDVLSASSRFEIDLKQINDGVNTIRLIRKSVNGLEEMNPNRLNQLLKVSSQVNEFVNMPDFLLSLLNSH